MTQQIISMGYVERDRATIRPPLRLWVLFLIVLSASFEYRFLASLPGVPSVSSTEIIVYFCVFILFLDEIVFRHALRNILKGVFRENPWVVIYFAWVAVATVVNVIRGYGFLSVSQFRDLIPSFFIVFIIFAYSRCSTQIYVCLVKLLLIAAFVNLLIGFGQGLIGWPRPWALSAVSAGKMDVEGRLVSDLMASGWFNHPNPFATFLIPMVPLLYLTSVGRIKLPSTWRFLAVLCVPMLAFVFLKTHGKAAFLWAMLSLLFCVLPMRRLRKSWLAQLALTALAIITLVLGGVWGAAYWKVLATINTRVQLWEAAILALQSDIFFALFGAANFKVLDFSYLTTSGHFPYPSAHNGVLNQAISFGLPALVFYLIAIMTATRSMLSKIKVSVAGYDVIGEVRLFVSVSMYCLVGEYFFEPASEGVLLQAQLFMFLGLAISLGTLDSINIEDANNDK